MKKLVPLFIVFTLLLTGCASAADTSDTSTSNSSSKTTSTSSAKKTLNEIAVTCPTGDKWTCERDDKGAYTIKKDGFPPILVDIEGPLVETRTNKMVKSIDEAWEYLHGSYGGYGMQELNEVDSGKASGLDYNLFEVTNQTYYATVLEKDDAFYSCVAYVNSDYYEEAQQSEMAAVCDSLK